jgi:DDB1- and CUL4-associated factor 5
VEESQGPENPRDVFSHEEYMSLMHSSGQNMTHDYTNQNTTEDPRMMAFFDYLVQQEIEGWDSESSDHSSEHSSENSSRPCSSQSSSDAEPATSNYLGGPSRATRGRVDIVVVSEELIMFFPF